jgi:hypothetical protein
MPASSPAPLTARQRVRILAGGVMIAYGIISAVVSYYNNAKSYNGANPIDYFMLAFAWDGAMAHAAVWVGAGTVLIFWYLIGPRSSPPKPGADD